MDAPQGSVLEVPVELGFLTQVRIRGDEEVHLWGATPSASVVMGRDNAQALAHEVRRRKALGFGTLERTRVFRVEPNCPSHSMVHGQRFAAKRLWGELNSDAWR